MHYVIANNTNLVELFDKSFFIYLEIGFYP